MKTQIANIATITTIARTATRTPSWAGSALKKLAATALLGLATLSFADAKAPDCVPGTLSEYKKLGTTGCVIGDKTFSNFKYHKGVDGLSSKAISLTPGTIPETDEPGLLFEAKWTSASRESFVSYNVEVQPNGKPITGASLQMQFGEIAGTGKVTVLTDLCPFNDATASCESQKLELKVVLSGDGSKTPQDAGQFKEPQKEILVITPIDVAPGQGGSAALDAFMAVFR